MTRSSSTRAKVLWAVWMTGFGIAVAVVTYLVTSSVGWTLVALLASGVVGNAIGQMVTQPAHAVRDAARAGRVPRSRHGSA